MSDELEPIRFTGAKRHKVSRPCQRSNYKQGMSLIYVYPTNYGDLTIDEMAALFQEIHGRRISRHTINTRIDRYGMDENLVFSLDHISHGGSKEKPRGRKARSIESIKVGSLEEKYL